MPLMAPYLQAIALRLSARAQGLREALENGIVDDLKTWPNQGDAAKHLRRKQSQSPGERQHLVEVLKPRA